MSVGAAREPPKRIIFSHACTQIRKNSKELSHRVHREHREKKRQKSFKPRRARRKKKYALTTKTQRHKGKMGKKKRFF
jgi:hypothetical protein